ncbi:MerR family transcriptional regulator [Hymenobacter chitinivorans]|uniref:DNA-binding transcriptional MerR regulator n=1 Tax=Hymenobacter chitinivorans DSM 11115 TaxID=1121954 RepID=A0A2M9BSU9_9BACT|nr:MerR family transcriptional regulator [Hymenobacter chitinivorans]PJJ61024.1 DNA-binding transcriptional MerR regulator [Hymenobacter chitinivorans DSM 11115]
MAATFLSCQQLAQLAGVSVRTLHHYDRIGLLRPSQRTEARYRRYGPPELLRLQQILFYKELDFTLEQIQQLLDDPAFDLTTALQRHRQALQARHARLGTLLSTLDQTISHLNGTRTMLTNEELYAGFPNDQAEAYRREVVAKYGPATIAAAEQHLRQLGKPGLDQLIAEQKDINRTLRHLRHLDPASPAVQAQVARHYANIVGFWGPAVAEADRPAAYQGLAQLYLDDPRYTKQHDGEDSPAYAQFLSAAIRCFGQ